MLTKVTAYSQWETVDPLVLNVVDRPETDLFEVRNIDGLGAVKADINTAPKGSISGTSFVGSNVGERNIVLTLGLTPDWDDWTVSKLRGLLNKYFLPEQSIRLEFETMEFSPMEISGYIESNEPNMFSKDSEHQISIICPDLYFRSVDPIVVTGITGNSSDITEIVYNGNVETGFRLQVVSESGTDDIDIIANLINGSAEFFQIDNALDDTRYLDVDSVAGEKRAQSVLLVDGTTTSLLQNIGDGSDWLKLKPGVNDFFVFSSDLGNQSWTVTYYERFGSL